MFRRTRFHMLLVAMPAAGLVALTSGQGCPGSGQSGWFGDMPSENGAPAVKVDVSTTQWKTARVYVQYIPCRLVSDASGATSDWGDYEEDWSSDTGTYSDGHLVTSWDRIGGMLDWGTPNYGTLNIDFDPQSLLVTSFHATKTATLTVPSADLSQQVTTTTISTIVGSGVQLRLTDEVGTPVLFGEVKGTRVCNFITSLSEVREQNNTTVHLERKNCKEQSVLKIYIYPYGAEDLGLW